MRRIIFVFLFSLCVTFGHAAAADEPIKWVDFDVPVEALETALQLDIASQGQEKPLDWIEILAFAATRNGGRSGSYSTNYQMTGRELLTPDEVRKLDNRYAIQALLADIAALIVDNVLCVATEDAGRLILFQNNRRAFYINFQRIALCNLQSTTKLNGQDNASQLINFPDNTG